MVVEHSLPWRRRRTWHRPVRRRRWRPPLLAAEFVLRTTSSVPLLHRLIRKFIGPSLRGNSANVSDCPGRRTALDTDTEIAFSSGGLSREHQRRPPPRPPPRGRGAGPGRPTPGPGAPIPGGPTPGGPIPGGPGTGISTSRSTSTRSGTQTGNHGSMYTGGGGGNSHTTVVKFQYMPGGQGGGGGWAWPTAGEASSISDSNAKPTADTALRCSQGFIGHLLSVGSAWRFWVSWISRDPRARSGVHLMRC